MKTLIVEDDFTSRLLIQKILTPFGECHLATNGEEAVQAFMNSKTQNTPPYDLICLDIMMPGMDGQTALGKIREIEKELGIEPGKGAKIEQVSDILDADH
jgi:two-component system chemotaxis response regulator CheY